VLFIVSETVSRQPLIRLGIFKGRALTVSNVAMFLMSGGMFVMMFFPTLYMTQIKGYSAIEIGLAYLPWPVAMAVAGTLAQKIIAKWGPKLAMWPGLLILAAGLYALSFLDADSSYVWGILPGFLLTAIGAGFAWATLFLTASVGVKPEESGLASGLINTSQRVGSAIGLAAISSVAAAYTRDLVADGRATSDALTTGFDRAFLIAAAILVASAAIALIGLRSADGRQMPAPTESQGPDNPPVANLEAAMGE
jgi:predicted MFS family arabinose efflux permease